MFRLFNRLECYRLNKPRLECEILFNKSYYMLVLIITFTKVLYLLKYFNKCYCY